MSEKTGGFLLPPGADVEQIMGVLNDIAPGQYTAETDSMGWTTVSKKDNTKADPKLAALEALRYWAKNNKR